MESMKEDELPAWVLEAAAAAKNDLIPEKSKGRYLNAYELFKTWQGENGLPLGNYSENVILAYLKGLADKQCISTVWAIYSMLKAVLKLKYGVDISKYASVTAFLKSRSKGYRPKQARVFQEHEINKFLCEAPDREWLAVKVVAIMGILGACRCHELADLLLKNVEDMFRLYLVKVPVTKTDIYRSFTVSHAYYDIVKMYISKRPAGCNVEKFFLTYRNGVCLRQCIGKNTISKMPKKIADYLELDDTSAYTGHSFRRTSATFLANGGGDLLAIKRQGGWKSSTVAERYIEDSVKTKQKNESLITGVIEKERIEKPATVTTNLLKEKNLNEKKKIEKFVPNFDVDIDLSGDEKGESGEEEDSDSDDDDLNLLENDGCRNLNICISSRGKREGGWKSSSVGERYVEESFKMKQKTESLIEKDNFDSDDDWYVTPVVRSSSEEERESSVCDSRSLEKKKLVMSSPVPEKKKFVKDSCLLPENKKLEMVSRLLEKEKKGLGRDSVENESGESKVFQFARCKNLVLHFK